MDEIIKKAYLSRLEDCLPVDFSDGVKFGVGLCKDKKFTEEDVKMYIKAFHLDVLEGIYSKEKLEWCNDWLKQNLNKQV